MCTNSLGTALRLLPWRYASLRHAKRLKCSSEVLLKRGPTIAYQFEGFQFMNIKAADSSARPNGLRMRLALWPEATVQEHLAEMQQALQQPGRYGQFLAAAGHPPRSA